MITFAVGILILIIGYIFYSRYVEKQFGLNSGETPAQRINDGVDYIPLGLGRNMLIHLLNIAGLGPILGAIQGILFGPVAFILIPLGCIFMGSVHDYFSGMLSLRNDGAQITELIKKYLGKFSCSRVFDAYFACFGVCLYGRRFNGGEIFCAKQFYS